MAVVRGTNRDDVLQAESDTGDTVLGERGNDTVLSGPGDDILRGGGGNDNLSAGEGRDRLFGELGNDRLVAGTNLTAMTGGDGQDTFVIGPDSGDTTIADFQRGRDTILLSDFTGVDSFADIRGLITVSGRNSILDLSDLIGADPGTEVVTILGVTRLTAANFSFSSGQVFLVRAEPGAEGSAVEDNVVQADGGGTSGSEGDFLLGG